MEYGKKKQQIKKYISIINLRNKIDNQVIKEKYIDNFEKRFSLNINSENNNIAKKYVYMLISNSEYRHFTYRFLDKKNYTKESYDEFGRFSAITPDEFICFGFVNFATSVNSNSFLSIEFEEQKNR